MRSFLQAAHLMERNIERDPASLRECGFVLLSDHLPLDTPLLDTSPEIFVYFFEDFLENVRIFIHSYFQQDSD